MKFWLVRIGSVALPVLGCLLLEMVVTGGSSTFVQRSAELAGLYVTLAEQTNSFTTGSVFGANGGTGVS